MNSQKPDLSGFTRAELFSAASNHPDPYVRGICKAEWFERCLRAPAEPKKNKGFFAWLEDWMNK